MSDLVKEHIEETTSTKGLKFIDSFEKQPVLDGIYRRKRIKLAED